MKAIPKNELIALINAWPRELVLASAMDCLFKIYGDDYHHDHGGSEWELTNVNEKRSEWIAAQELKKA